MHTIKKIGQTFSYITPISLTDRPILGMVVGNNKTLMIDAGNSEDHANYFIQKTLKQENVTPDMVVLTHWHWDHILVYRRRLMRFQLLLQKPERKWRSFFRFLGQMRRLMSG